MEIISNILYCMGFLILAFSIIIMVLRYLTKP